MVCRALWIERRAVSTPARFTVDFHNWAIPLAVSRPRLPTNNGAFLPMLCPTSDFHAGNSTKWLSRS